MFRPNFNIKDTHTYIYIYDVTLSFRLNSYKYM